jgi:hypothetical protein
MSKLKNTNKLAAVALGALSLVGYNAYAVEVTVGGNIQIVNLLNASGQLGLDFTSPATQLEVASFTISNNTTSWDLGLTFANTGDFNSALTGQDVTPTLWEYYLTNHATNAGAGIVDIPTGARIDATAAVQGAGIVYSPADQTTATSGLVVALSASWAASTNLAGLYTENITATLSATP